ncbi:glycosyltransferase family 4 protein [bacterium]|nr:glycosyltransferase family 4 protein [bacterium]
MSKKIKVIHIITQLELGGAQQTTLYTLAHLDKTQYIPVLICGPGGILLQEALKIPGLRVHICPGLRRPIAPFYDLIALINMRGILRKEKLAHSGSVIVHTHSSKAGILGRCAACLAGISIRIHTVHGFGFNPYQPFLLRWALVLAEAITGVFTTRMIYVSRDNLREGIRLGISRPKRSVIIRSGVNWDEFSMPVRRRPPEKDGKNHKQDGHSDDQQSGMSFDRSSSPSSIRESLCIPKNARIVGMISCFKPQKAPLDFIRMARIVDIENKKTRRSKQPAVSLSREYERKAGSPHLEGPLPQDAEDLPFPETHFILIGDGSLKASIKGMIRGFGLESKVHLLGWRRDIPPLIGAMDIMALTSLWEGLPKVVVEAQLMGVPVVATRTSGIGETIRNGITGFITPPGRPDLMASKIIGMLRDPDALERMGKEAKSAVSREFDLNDAVAKQDRLYQELARI